MRIAIILFSNMRYSPYYQMYAAQSENMANMTYDVIYPDRFPELQEPNDEHHIRIEWGKKKLPMKGKANKILDFVFFRNRVMEVLKKNNYDKVVVLTTIPAVLLGAFLRKYFCGRYLIDIRDYTMESNVMFRLMEKWVLQKSGLNVISSPGFTHFLPKGEYIVCHNMNASITEAAINRNVLKKKRQLPIIISYIGSITYADQCKKLIDLVVKDERFVFYLYGNEISGTIVSDYVEEQQCNRIRMMGRFAPDDKEKIYADSDIVFNCYGNGRMLLKYALSNKLYDGALYKRPLLVSPDTMMAEISGQYAFQIDLAKCDSLDNLYCWYNELNETDYQRHAVSLLHNAIMDNQHAIDCITRFLKE